MRDPTGRGAVPRLVVTLTFVNTVLLSSYALSQWIAWGGLGFVTALGVSTLQIVIAVVYVVAANVLCGLLFVWLLHLIGLSHRAWPSRIAIAAGASALAASARSLLLFKVSSPVGFADGFAGWIASFAGFMAAVTMALWIGDLLARARQEHELRAEQEVLAARRIARLEFEDTVHRRRVADRLHGSVQNGLVLVAAQLDQAATSLAAKEDAAAADIREAAALLDHIREDQVRALSHALFPVGAETGLVRAIGGVLDRLPSTLSGELIVNPSYGDAVGRDGEIVDLPARVILTDTIEEAITNAVKHGKATSVQITLDLRSGPDRRILALEARDNGSGLGEPSPNLNGMQRHCARIAARDGTLILAAADQGARLSVTLPLRDDSTPS